MKTRLRSQIKFVSLLLLSILVYVHPSKAVAEATPTSTETLRWKMAEREGFSTFKIPKIVSYKNEEILRKVNQVIKDATANLRCDPENSREDLANLEHEVHMTVTFSEQGIFSIQATSSYFCGGAHPNDDTFSMTFDLDTGDDIKFEELFADYQKQKAEILSTLFAKQIERAEKYGKSLDDGSCDHSGVFLKSYLIDGMYSEFDYNFTKKGIEVKPRWSHAVEACAERVLTPYKKLSGFAKSGGIIERVAGKFKSK